MNAATLTSTAANSENIRANMTAANASPATVSERDSRDEATPGCKV